MKKIITTLSILLSIPALYAERLPICTTNMWSSELGAPTGMNYQPRTGNVLDKDGRVLYEKANVDPYCQTVTPSTLRGFTTPLGATKNPNHQSSASNLPGGQLPYCQIWVKGEPIQHEAQTPDHDPDLYSADDLFEILEDQAEDTGNCLSVGSVSVDDIKKAAKRVVKNNKNTVIDPLIANHMQPIVKSAAINARPAFEKATTDAEKHDAVTQAFDGALSGKILYTDNDLHQATWDAIYNSMSAVIKHNNRKLSANGLDKAIDDAIRAAITQQVAAEIIDEATDGDQEEDLKAAFGINKHYRSPNNYGA